MSFELSWHLKEKDAINLGSPIAMDDLFLESKVDIKKPVSKMLQNKLKWHLTLLLGNDTIYDANYCYVL